MCASVKADCDFALSDGDIGRHIDEVAEDLASLGIGIAAHAFGEYPLEAAGDLQKEHIEIDFESDAGRQSVNVKKPDSIG